MTFGELLAQLLGWLGDFIQFIISWFPRIVIVRYNEMAVAYRGGDEPVALRRGIHWYWPWRTKVVSHEVTRFALSIEPIPLETADGVAVEIGMVVVYRIADILAYEVDNFHPDDNIKHTAQGELCTIVKGHKWEDLAEPTEEGSRLEGKLSRRMQKALDKFGVRVESCRPNGQIRLSRGASHLFGMTVSVVDQHK